MREHRNFSSDFYELQKQFTANSSFWCERRVTIDFHIWSNSKSPVSIAANKAVEMSRLYDFLPRELLKILACTHGLQASAVLVKVDSLSVSHNCIKLHASIFWEN